MKHELQVTFENDFVQILSKGEKSLETSLNLWKETIQVCNQHKCYKILGLATSIKPPTTIESYKHADLLHDFKIDHTYKIAWIEFNPEAVGSIKFLENVLFNRGLDVKLFQDVDEAKSWLLSKD